ncbi:YbaK/EbsC family protein [Photobacterium sp. GJ3]|uniref:aminoacyl-tRNA deacylase n=1 Tax=Photobacterium sp. GJ3 TaxID=2829502 RepID=UPI001B8CFD64|nr:YbaK/EbsC family protein [Photobacterium sp. GJ3]QUJ69168.1 YbaK/EbsC family protein [Photobacterium sp. GJ3]
MLDTPVTRFLQQEGIPFLLLPHSQPARTIEEAAQARGVSPELMVKTILLRDMGGLHVLACVPGTRQVDPKKVRGLFGCRRMTCADAKDVEAVTGLKIGTVAPVGLKHPLPVIFDESLKSCTRVNISSGNQMAGIELAFQDLALLCKPCFGDICR